MRPFIWVPSLKNKEPLKTATYIRTVKKDPVMLAQSNYVSYVIISFSLSNTHKLLVFILSFVYKSRNVKSNKNNNHNIQNKQI